jgi:5-oxoprolinase (ATP-hydrolysing)
MRLILNMDLPLNDGLLRNIRFTLPRCLLNPDFNKPMYEIPAVVGGNTEVSQRLTDTLLKALNMAACSQGTMNNLLFGNDIFGFYETICGGTGAVEGHNGTDAVHQHMTNTRITDPEILELRYPVRLECFRIRHDSGGSGKWHGGNGVERRIRFLTDVQVSLLSQHRKSGPYGMNGGEEGSPGSQYIDRKDGNREYLDGCDQARCEAGDTITILTPGGGGWGHPG